MLWILMKLQQWLCYKWQEGIQTCQCCVTSIHEYRTKKYNTFKEYTCFYLRKYFTTFITVKRHSIQTQECAWILSGKLPCISYLSLHLHYINFHFRLQLHNTVHLCKHYNWKITAVFEICWVCSRIDLANWILYITFWSVIFLQLLYCSI